MGFPILLRIKKKVKRTSDLRNNIQTRRSRDKGWGEADRGSLSTFLAQRPAVWKQGDFIMIYNAVKISDMLKKNSQVTLLCSAFSGYPGSLGTAEQQNVEGVFAR